MPVPFYDRLWSALCFVGITCLVSFSLISCNLLGLPKAIVLNRSGQTISNAQLVLCDQKRSIPPLAPNQTYEWQFRPKQDCSLAIQGKLPDGTPLQRDGTYTTPGDNAEFQLTVLANGKVTYDRRSPY